MTQADREERVVKQPLNPNAKKWVEALRSGEYEQAQRKLTTDGKYCCLGVACVLAEAEGVKADWRGQEYLPNEVMDWLGLDSKDGEFQECGEFNAEDVWTDTLADRNDSGKTFTEIADIIESQPNLLFKRVTA